MLHLVDGLSFCASTTRESPVPDQSGIKLCKRCAAGTLASPREPISTPARQSVPADRPRDCTPSASALPGLFHEAASRWSPVQCIVFSEAVDCIDGTELRTPHPVCTASLEFSAVRFLRFGRHEARGRLPGKEVEMHGVLCNSYPQKPYLGVLDLYYFLPDVISRGLWGAILGISREKWVCTA